MRGRTLVLSAALAFVVLMTLTGSAWAGAAAPTSSLRIETTDKGLHKVTAAQIAGGLGRSESIVRALLAIGGVAVTNQGCPVAWAATPDRSALLFWAEAIDSQYATANVYSLTLAKGTRMSSAAPARASGVARTSFPETLTFERDVMAATALFTDPAADYWGWDILTVGSADLDSKQFALEAPSVVGGTSVEIGLQGVTSSGLENEHHLQVCLNDKLLGETHFTGLTAKRLTLALPPGLLTSGTNQLELTAVKDDGVAYSIVMLDDIRLRYERGTVAVGDQLALREPSAGLVTVTNLSDAGALILDLADPRLPKLVKASSTGTSDAGPWVRFAVAGRREYAVATAAGALTPQTITPVAAGTLRMAGRGADYLIITHPSLVNAAGRLAAYRAAQGLTTSVVTTTEIYDEFGYGLPGPPAIKSFLGYVRGSWRPAPRYVVLAGEGSYDYRNLTGKGDSLVPPLMVGTDYGLAPSDVALADVARNDGVAEFALGRIPAGSETQLDAYLAKVTAYEAATGAWRTRALFVADDLDPDAGDFAATSDALAARLPDSLAVTRLNLFAPQTRDEVRDGLLAAFGPHETDGDLLVNYVGHGSVTRLASEDLLNTADIAGFTNSPRLPIFSAFSCVVGNYGLPGADSLAEALVGQPGGGAVAALAASALEDNEESQKLAKSFMDATFGGARSVVLGERVRAAAQQAAASRAVVWMLRTYNLLGDPALMVSW